LEITQHLLRRSAMSYASACEAERRHGERDVAHRLVRELELRDRLAVATG
jgi:hypothetical protein